MIDAVIRNLIKLMKILKSQITLLNILEDTDINRDTVYKHRQASVKNNNKKNNTQCREILHKSIEADKAPSISPLTLPRAREHALRD